jgi:hypothetical protein
MSKLEVIDFALKYAMGHDDRLDVGQGIAFATWYADTYPNGDKSCGDAYWAWVGNQRVEATR